MKRKKLAAALILCVLALLAGMALPLALPGGSDRERDYFVGWLALPRELEEEEAADWPQREGDRLDRSYFSGGPVSVLWGDYDEEKNTYRFDGLKGANCFWVVLGGPEEPEEWTSSGYDGLSAIHLTYGDQEERLEGTLYVPMKGEDAVLVWLYPVFQTRDGRVYVTWRGAAPMMGGSQTRYGQRYSRFEFLEGQAQIQVHAPGERAAGASQTWQGTRPSGGKKSGQVDFSITVAVEPISPLTGWTVKQLDEENRLLRRDWVEPGEEEQQLTLEEGTVWVLAEERRADGTVKPVVLTPQEGEAAWSAPSLDSEDVCFWPGFLLSR